MTITIHPLFKPAAAVFAGLAASVVENVAPMFVLTAAFVVADTITSLRLQHRLAKAGKNTPVRFSSRRFTRTLATLGRILGLLVLTAMADHLILVPLGLGAMKFVAGAVCFWQAVSLLENEAAANDAPWAAYARRFLVDKAKRFLDTEKN